ncbi:uncharacterized protein LOC105443505 [Strongylocentrotus purpuratus]|uniref:Uncharacterized protein n=1 Tax=Strongylocentrotus purpuratus TaxID=7668 RepID=A0A7M7NPF3_STRPU|nr:uncharacterized protein LOC105443505 [Strongylocentrotus purpuratus]
MMCTTCGKSESHPPDADDSDLEQKQVDLVQPSDLHQPVISGSGQLDGTANLRLTIVQAEITEPPTSPVHGQTRGIQLIQEHNGSQIQTQQQGQTLEPELVNGLDHALDQAPDEAPIRTPTDAQVLANIQTQADIKRLANARRTELTASGYMMVTPTKPPKQPITGADRNPTYPDGAYMSMRAIRHDLRELDQRRGSHGELKGTNLYPVLQTSEPFHTYMNSNGPRHVEEPNSPELHRNSIYHYAVPSQGRRPLDEPSAPVYDRPMLPARSLPTPSKLISETWEKDGITYINGNIKPPPRVLPQQEKKEIVYY